MNLDSNTLASILRLNGLTPQSPAEQIYDLLAKAGYTKEQVDPALVVLLQATQQPAPMQSASQGAMPPMASMPMASVTPAPLPYSSMPVASGGALLGSFALIGNGWNLYKTRLLSLLGVSVLPFAIIIIAIVAGILGVSGILIASHVSAFSDYLKHTSGIVLALVVMGIIIGVFILVAAILILFALSSIALMYAARGTDAGENISVGESYKQAVKHIWGYIWIGILEVFVVIGRLAVWAGIPILVISIALRFSSSILITIVLSALLFIIGIAALVLLAQTAVWFYFSLWELIQNNRKGLEALAASREYVKGYFGALVWRSFVIGIVLGILEIVVNVLTSLISFSSVSLHNLLVYIVSVFLFTPLTLCIIYCLYENIRAINPIPAADFSKFKKALTVYSVAGVIAIFVVLGLSVVLAKNIATLVPSNMGVSSPLTTSGANPIATEIARNNARTLGRDAALKSDLSSFLLDASLDYDGAGNTYGTAPFTMANAANNPFTGTGSEGTPSVLAFGTGSSGDSRIANIFNGAPIPGALYYASNGNAFFIAVQLSSGYFCVDSTGNEKTVTQTPTASGDGSTYSCSQP